LSFCINTSFILIAGGNVGEPGFKLKNSFLLDTDKNTLQRKNDLSEKDYLINPSTVITNKNHGDISYHLSRKNIYKYSIGQDKW